MENKTEHYNWQAYWKGKKTNLTIPLGKHVAKDIVSALIKTFPKELLPKLRILEVGCGEGHILGWLANRNKAIKPSNIVGIEINSGAIKAGRIEYPAIKFLRKNIIQKNWTSRLGSFDLIFFVNTLHEVFSSKDYRNLGEINTARGKQLVGQVINSATKLLSKGGYLLIYDGIEYDGDILNENITFTLNCTKSKKLFEKFCQEYSAYKIKVHKTSNKNKLIISMNKRDFSRFATKISLIDTNLWDIEKNESYQFMNENEFSRILNSNGLSIVYKGMFTSEIDKWNSTVNLENGEFPFEHAVFVGKRL